MVLLGVITIVEVAIALVGKGYIGGVDFGATKVGAAIIGLSMIALSLFKAIKIIFEFMHMKYEVKGLAMSVLLPMGLLIWAVFAFFSEGNSWNVRRTLIKNKNAETVDDMPKKSSSIIDLKDVKNLN